MLTRSGVAKRLGKSIATVRRLENVALHPVRDARGVLRFSEEEVERLAGSEHRVGLPSQPHTGFPRNFEGELNARDAAIDELSERTLALERARQDERSRFADRLDWLERQLRRTHRAREDSGAASSAGRPDQTAPDRDAATDATERECLRAQAVELLASLTPREMKRMPPDDLEAIIELAEGD